MIVGNLKLIYGNIIDNLKDIEVVINSNNARMMLGSGICGTIYRAAGHVELENYCNNTFRSEMKVNEVRITPGFNIPIDIMHIYCPKFNLSKSPLEELKQSYINLLNKILSEGYKSAISVSLGTGVYGYKHELIADMVISTITGFVENNNIDFTMILPDKDILKIYERYMKK